MVSDRGSALEQGHPADEDLQKGSDSDYAPPLNAPNDQALVEWVEETAIKVWDEEKEDKELPHRFYFVQPDNTCEPQLDQYRFPPPKGSVQSWFFQEYWQHQADWKDAKAVVFAYRGPKSLRFQIVFTEPGKKRIYCFSVNLKSGEGTWAKPNTELSAEMRKALAAARR